MKPGDRYQIHFSGQDPFVERKKEKLNKEILIREKIRKKVDLVRDSIDLGNDLGEVWDE